MTAINRAFSANLNETLLLKAHLQARAKCIFISHQQKDKLLCRRIADYIMQEGIDIYFDEDDRDLKIEREKNDPAGVVDSIRKGINKSTHMLCVVSAHTLKSLWVPWEVGYGYEKTEVSVLTLQGIDSADLPHYMLTCNLVRGTISLDRYIQTITGARLFMENRYFTRTTHSLYGVLDTDK